MIESLKELNLENNWPERVDDQLAENFVNMLNSASLTKINLNSTKFGVEFERNEIKIID